MNRRALLVVLTSCALAPACADTTDSPSSWELHDSTPQDHPPSTQPEVPSPSEVSSPAVPPLDLPEIAYPDDCDTPPPRHTTWTQTGQNTDSPLLTEVFGEQGCMMERFHYARDARERITREEYDVFEDWLPYKPYVSPVSYTREATWGEGPEPIHQVMIVEHEKAPITPEDTPITIETTRVYDDAHPTRLLKFHRETRTEGKTTAIEETVKTYRTDGRPLETRHLINGALSEGQRVSYDDLGHEMKAWHTIGGEEYLVREWRWSEDRRRSTLKTYRPLGGMSQLLKSETWTYDEEGNLLQETRHHEGGSWRSIKTFDAQERPVLLEEDSDLDGQTNYSRAWTYDEAGRELHRLTLRLNGHGKIERRDEVTSTYDDQGRPLTRIDEGPAYDIHAEAVIPTVLRHRWTYNAGETLHYIRRNDSDWLLKEREITNEAGQPLLREVFDAHIGEPARRIAHTYDAAGRRISRHTTYYGRTPHESIERWHYDARGRLVRHTFDKGDDGSLEMRTEHRY